MTAVYYDAKAIIKQFFHDVKKKVSRYHPIN